MTVNRGSRVAQLHPKEVWKFKMPSGIIGNEFAYKYGWRQYVGVYCGMGGWAGIGRTGSSEFTSQ